MIARKEGEGDLCLKRCCCWTAACGRKEGEEKKRGADADKFSNSDQGTVPSLKKAMRLGKKRGGKKGEGGDGGGTKLNNSCFFCSSGRRPRRKLRRQKGEKKEKKKKKKDRGDPETFFSILL